jgi:hypothetical protein
MSRRRKFLIVTGIVFGVMIFIPVIHHYQLRFAVANYVAELKAKGEPMDLAQVIPNPVPPEQNSTPFFLKAAGILTTNSDVLSTNPPVAMHGVAAGKAMVSWTQPEIRATDATNSWKEIQTALSQNDEALNLLLKITNSAFFDFNLQYAQAFDMKLTHLVLEKKAAQRLAYSAIYDLHSGDAGSATKNIRTIFVLVNGTHEERTAISQLVRIAIAQIGIAATWELLQSPNLTDEDLAGLQSDLFQMEFIRAEINVLPVEREGDMATLIKWRGSNAEFEKYFDVMQQVHEAMGNPVEEDSFWNKAQFKAKEFLWRYWWSYPDELRCHKGYEVLMNALRSVDANGSFQSALAVQENALDKLGISRLNSSLDSLFSGETDFRSMLSESIMALAGVTRKVMQVDVAKETALAAIALKRYQLKYGHYPPDLNSLVPEFISAVPLDSVDGQPLRYRRNSDGSFLLYSVGENGKDDGGDPSLEKGITSSNYSWQNIHALDWVWPQPATRAEIQAFYAHPPK